MQLQSQVLIHRRPEDVGDAEVGNDYCKVQLTNSDGNARFFKNAEWMFRAEACGEDTLLTCSVNFVLRARYLLFAPILWMMRGAIQRDLQQLKSVLERDIPVFT